MTIELLRSPVIGEVFRMQFLGFYWHMSCLMSACFGTGCKTQCVYNVSVCNLNTCVDEVFYPLPSD